MTRSPTTSFRTEPGNGAFVIFAFVAVVTITPLKHRGWSWITYAGALTCPLYLIHEQWGRWVIGLVNPVAGKWVAVLAAILVSVVLAMIIERWVERPLRPRLRRALQRSFDAITQSDGHDERPASQLAVQSQQ